MYRPNGGSATRWLGIIDLYIWASKFSDALQKYNEPEDCVKSDDGSTFKDHTMSADQFLACHQLAAILQPLQVLVSVLEATKTPTSNLVKPFVGKMIDRLDMEKNVTTTYRGKKEVIRVCHVPCLMSVALPY